MFTTPRLIVIALCAALNVAIGTVVYLVKLPIYLDFDRHHPVRPAARSGALGRLRVRVLCRHHRHPHHRPPGQSLSSLVPVHRRRDCAGFRIPHGRGRHDISRPADGNRHLCGARAHLRYRHRAGRGGRLGAGRGLSVRRRDRQRIDLHRRVVPQDGPAAVERGAPVGTCGRADRQDPAGAARRTPLSCHAGRLHRDAAGATSPPGRCRDDAERSHHLRPRRHRRHRGDRTSRRPHDHAGAMCRLRGDRAARSRRQGAGLVGGDRGAARRVPGPRVGGHDGPLAGRNGRRARRHAHGGIRLCSHDLPATVSHRARDPARW